MRNLLHAAVFLTSLSLVACGGATDDASGGSAGAGESGAATFNVTGNDLMRFSETSFTATVGSTITINFKNEGSQPKNIMGHNLVVLKPGQEPIAFSTRVMSEGGDLENNHLPESVKGDVVVATKVLGPGEEETISFTPEAAGTYPYVCTFPGHAAIMKGEIIVK